MKTTLASLGNSVNHAGNSVTMVMDLESPSPEYDAKVKGYMESMSRFMSLVEQNGKMHEFFKEFPTFAAEFFAKHNMKPEQQP